MFVESCGFYEPSSFKSCLKITIYPYNTVRVRELGACNFGRELPFRAEFILS